MCLLSRLYGCLFVCLLVVVPLLGCLFACLFRCSFGRLHVCLVAGLFLVFAFFLLPL